jgi:hypothetical protein
MAAAFAASCSMASPAPAPTATPAPCESHVATFLNTASRSGSGQAAIYGLIRSAASCDAVTDVQVIAFQGGADVRTLFIHAAAQADASGRFSVEVPPGTYRVLFLPGATTKGVAPSWWKDTASFGGGTNITVDTSDVALGDVLLPAGYAIRGTLADAQSHAGLAGASVAVVRAVARSGAAGVDYVTIGRTERDGRYSLAVPAGRFQVEFIPDYPYAAMWWRNAESFAAADDLVVQDVTTGIDVLATRGKTVTGRITYNGAPSANIAVMAVAGNAPCCELGDGGRTDQDGRYRFALHDGAYRLALYAATGSGSEVRPFWLGGSGAFNDATVVQVNRDISGLDFALSGP